MKDDKMLKDSKWVWSTF